MPQKLTKQYIIDEYKKCYRSPAYFASMYCYIQHPTEGRIKFNLWDFQKDVIEKFRDNKKVIVLKSRQIGLSTLCAAYILWLILFFDDKNVLIVATKQTVARNLFIKVGFMYDNLPKWLRGESHDEYNKLSLRLKNGSQVKAIAGSDDMGRSESLSCLIIDECQNVDNQLLIRNKITGGQKYITFDELFTDYYNENSIEIPEMFDAKIKFISGWEVETPTGFQDFKGVKKITLQKYVHLKIKRQNNNVTEFKCSENHKLKLIDNTFRCAKNLITNDVLFNNNVILSVSIVNESIDLYDLLNVKNGNEYITESDIINHNCAFIENIDVRWPALQQAAAAGQIIALSTPNGPDGKFFDLYTDAESGINGYIPIKLKWDVHPEHDDVWRAQQDKELGQRMADQECNCSFVSSGNTVIEPEILQIYETTCKFPILKSGNQDKFWVWKEPEYNHDYIIAVDTSRGDAGDSSGIQVIDSNTMESISRIPG